MYIKKSIFNKITLEKANSLCVCDKGKRWLNNIEGTFQYGKLEFSSMIENFLCHSAVFV